jgi:hypothetical protein
MINAASGWFDDKYRKKEWGNSRTARHSKAQMEQSDLTQSRDGTLNFCQLCLGVQKKSAQYLLLFEGDLELMRQM